MMLARWTLIGLFVWSIGFADAQNCPNLAPFQSGDKGVAANASISVQLVGSQFSTQAATDIKNSISDVAALPNTGFTVSGGQAQNVSAAPPLTAGTAQQPVAVYVVGDPVADGGCAVGSAACTHAVQTDSNGNVTQYTVVVLSSAAASASSLESLYAHEASHGVLGIHDCDGCANTLAEAGTSYTKPTSCDSTFVKNNGAAYGGAPCANCSPTCDTPNANSSPTCTDPASPGTSYPASCTSNGFQCTNACLNPAPSCPSPQTAHCVANSGKWECYSDSGAGCAIVIGTGDAKSRSVLVPMDCSDGCGDETPPCSDGSAAVCSAGTWSCSGTACVGDTPTCPDGSAATCDYTGSWVCGTVTTSQCDGAAPCAAATCSNGTWDSSSCDCSDVCNPDCSVYNYCGCYPNDPSCGTTPGSCEDECNPECENYDPYSCGACDCDYSCDEATPIGKAPALKLHPMCKNETPLPGPRQTSEPVVATLPGQEGEKQHAIPA